MWKAPDIFTTWVSFNYRDRHWNCREEVVQHSNLKVKWNLRKSGWNLWVAGKDPARQGELFPLCREKEQQQKHSGLGDTAGLLLSIYFSTKDVSSGFPSCSNTSSLLEWGYLQIYIFKRKRRIKHFIFCGKQDTRKIDPTKILFFLT